MGSGVRDLRQYQIGKETTPGTAVAATTRLVSELEFDPQEPVFQPEAQLGILLENPTTDVIALRSTDATWSGDLTYEQILHLLHMSLEGGVTPVGAGADKTWTFDPTFAADPALNAFTLQKRMTDGTTNWDERIAYVLARGFSIRGAIGENAKFEADLYGRPVERDSAITAAIAIPSVNFVPVSAFKLFVDDTFAGIGTTQMLETITDFNFDYRAPSHPSFFVDGRTDKSFSRHSLNRVGFDFRCAAEYNATVHAERAKAASRALRYARLVATGPALGGGNYKVQIDMCLRYREGEFDAEGEREDADAVSLDLIQAYDPTNSFGLKVVVVNGLAALP